MSTPRILIQLDTDSHPSVFDSVVAVDAGVDHLFRHGGVEPHLVQGLVHGAMFTRSAKQLHNTAIFVGGSDVAAGEAVLAAVCQSFFGPVRVSAMIDSNGSNTTAAAAVLAAAEHLVLPDTTALVLGATGPVGARVTRLLARQGAHVRSASRSLTRAQDVCGRVDALVEGARLVAVGIDSDEALLDALQDVELVICAGAAGVELLSAAARGAAADLRVVIDLNAVPPLGVAGIEVHDRAKEYDGVICYGAIGIGGAKMKIHTAAIQKLFEGTDNILDAEQIFEIGQGLA